MKNIPNEELKTLFCGTFDVWEQDGLLIPYRMNNLQRKAYTDKTDQYQRTYAAASISLNFITTSTKCSFKMRNCWNETIPEKEEVELYINNVKTDSVERIETSTKKSDKYNLDVDFNLGEGKKHVQIYLTNFSHVEICDFAIDENTTVEKYEHKYKALVFGDSISEGFYSEIPSMTYVNILERKLDTEMINFSIGGEFLRPEIIGNIKYPKTDYIIVALGTNNYKSERKDVFTKKAIGVCKKLKKSFPRTRIFFLFPIWRKLGCLPRPLGYTQEEFQNYYMSLVKKHCGKNWVLTDCYNALNCDLSNYLDGLHPNAKGMTSYADFLEEKIKPYLSDMK